jgi:MoaA/NifB/PqqE/SkfB family radical SAM enzyme
MTPERYRVLQIHPTLRCNLRCLHCYSSSGPEVGGQLDAALLEGAISHAGAEGFTVLGVSGGEPLLYRALTTLLDRAHTVGMLTTVTSNGMFLDPRRLDRLHDRVDLLAISLDGTRESHDRMRAAEGAFDSMVSRLEGVRASGIPFGFIFTLTRENAHELEWVARFALEQGARLLQIHPLEQLGRARQGNAGTEPDRTTASRAYVEAKRIEHTVGNRLHVQLDLVHTGAYRNDTEALLTEGTASDPVSLPLASLVSPLVVEADGMVVPIEYGFSRRYALGSLFEAPLSGLAQQWKRYTYPAFRDLYCGAVADVTAPNAPPFANLYDVIATRAAGGPAARPH